MGTVRELATGTVIGGDYRIVRLLGTGGMGAVYVAEQLSTMRERALKVMLPELVADERQRERFEQEARVGALIESDHIVEILAAGVDSSTGVALPWIAMELLTGEDLGARVDAHGPLSIEETTEILRQLCHALGAAHGAGVVHRDIKPENVFAARSKASTGPLAVKVLDFGIAKVAALANRKATTTGAIGSPAWMAPEQTDPRAPVTPAADVWALGLLAFWLLTGHHYWRTVADPDAALIAIFREILLAPMPAASARAEELGCAPRLPAGFDAWFERCVDREPLARFADATACFQAFAELVASGALPEPHPLSRRGEQPLSRQTRALLDSLSNTVPASTARAAVQPRGKKRWLLAPLALLLAGGAALAAARSQPRAAHLDDAPLDLAIVRSPPPRPSLPPPEPRAEEPSVTADPPEPVRPQPPPKRKFDSAAAQSQIAVARRNAQQSCHAEDQRVVILALTFAPSGESRVLSATTFPRDDGAVACARGHFMVMRIPEFDGAAEVINTTVTLHRLR